MAIRIATGGTGSLTSSACSDEQSRPAPATPTPRLGTFDFHAGTRGEGAWCRSACHLLQWRWGTGSIQKFIEQVIEADRALVRQAWEQLESGETIDCVLRVQVGRSLRALRFVAGRSDEGPANHVAGLLQDVTSSRQTALHQATA
jgi:hypothetical protein